MLPKSLALAINNNRLHQLNVQLVLEHLKISLRLLQLTFLLFLHSWDQVTNDHRVQSFHLQVRVTLPVCGLLFLQGDQHLFLRRHFFLFFFKPLYLCLDLLDLQTHHVMFPPLFGQWNLDFDPPV